MLDASVKDELFDTHPSSSSVMEILMPLGVCVVYRTISDCCDMMFRSLAGVYGLSIVSHYRASFSFVFGGSGVWKRGYDELRACLEIVSQHTHQTPIRSVHRQSSHDVFIASLHSHAT